MATKLRKLEIREVSLNRHVPKSADDQDIQDFNDIDDIDAMSAASEGAFGIFKRRADEDDPAAAMFPRGERPLFFAAHGFGPTHLKLWNLFDDHRRALGSARASTAFEQAWSALTDSEKQSIRDEEAAAEKARAAAAAAEEDERRKEMNKLDDKVLVKAAHAIARGDIANTVRKSNWHGALRAMAAEQQLPDEKIIQETVARLVKTDPDALALLKAEITGVADDEAPAPVAAPVVIKNDANDTLRKLADQAMAADPGLTKLEALLKVHRDHPALAAKAKAA